MTDKTREILHSFHYKDGWHFTLFSGGDVLISHTDPGKPSDFELVVESDITQKLPNGQTNA
jgi:hypothetical protein